MPRDATAQAVRTSTGQRWILINLDKDLTDMEGWFMHEAAHHIAWDWHGEEIQTHGPEYRRVCRAVINVRQNYFCDHR